MAISGVTSETFSKLAVSFMDLNGGKGFVLMRRKGTTPGEHGPIVRNATPAQLGAWRAFFKRLGRSLTLFDRMDAITVPAEWPHQFDASVNPQEDRDAASWYQSRSAPQTPRGRLFDGQRVLDAEARKTAVKNRLGYDPGKRRGISKGAELPDTEPKYVDKDLLFRCADEALAAERVA